jgi:glycosyltransferase involved in cell wall biosynthesis
MKTKKILIDAKWLFNGPISGRVVLENLILHLKRYTNQYHFTLLLNSRDKKNIQYYRDLGFNVLHVLSFNNLITNVFIIPLLLIYKKIDIVLYQNFCTGFGSHKKVLYIHDVIYETHPEYFTRIELFYFKLVKYCANWADAIITISYNEKNRLIKAGYGSIDKIHVVYNGVDINRYNKLDVNPEFTNGFLPKHYVLYTGRINDRKNIKNLIYAMEYVNTDLSLVVVGKADWKNKDLQRLNISKEVKERIIFTGYLSDSDLFIVMKRATLFAYVSIEEGFGLPPVEAMQAGVPVVVSNTSCMPEICGDAAMYVNPKDSKDIAEGINTVYHNVDLRENLIHKGHIRSGFFNWESSVRKLIHVFDVV